MNLRKKKKLLSLIKQYKRGSRGRLKQYNSLHRDIAYFESVYIDKMFMPIIKLIENKMKPFNDILKFDLKIENKKVNDNRIENKYHNYNEIIVNNLDLSDKEKTTIKFKLVTLNRIGIVIYHGLINGKYITPYIQVNAPQSKITYDFDESKSKKLAADVQKYLMKGVNDTLNDIIKICKKIEN